MNELTIQNMVLISGNDVITTSLKVANYFNKGHKNILRKIDLMKPDCPDDIWQLNFEPSEYIDNRGKIHRMYKMTKNGFMLLAMSLTGKQAMAIKISYMMAFDYMLELIKKGRESFMKQHNDLMLEFMKEKDVASMSGRLLRRWGKVKKPELINKMQQLEQQSQLKLLV